MLSANVIPRRMVLYPIRRFIHDHISNGMRRVQDRKAVGQFSLQTDLGKIIVPRAMSGHSVVHDLRASRAVAHQFINPTALRRCHNSGLSSQPMATPFTLVP